MRLAPWHVKGIDPRARETAREAARRSGMSVGQWLTSVIHGQAGAQGAAVAAIDDEPQERRDNIASITHRLDALTRQLDRLAKQPPAPAVHDDTPRRIADAILQLNGRLDQVLTEGRHASSALERRVNSVDRALATLNQEKLRAGSGLAGQSTGVERSGVDAVVAEIAARQRALDGDVASARARAAPPPPVPSPPLPPPPLMAPPPPRLADYVPMHCRAEDALAGLRKDLAEIGRSLPNRRPSLPPAPQCRADDAIAGLRKELAQIGRTLADAMPRRAVEALETEVRALAGRLDSERRAGVDAQAFAGLDRGLREVRDELRGLAPAESLVGFDKALNILAGKIDQLAAGRQDPVGLHELEGAIASLRD